MLTEKQEAFYHECLKVLMRVDNAALWDACHKAGIRIDIFSCGVGSEYRKLETIPCLVADEPPSEDEGEKCCLCEGTGAVRGLWDAEFEIYNLKECNDYAGTGRQKQDSI